MASPADYQRQLEEENKILRAENHQLRLDNAAALFKLEKQVAIEKRYEESQSRFETIFYKSKMGNKIIAPDLRILQINDVFRLMLGYTEEEIIGTRIIAFSHPDFIHHWHELQENLWTKQIPSFQIETCLIRKDGTIFWCQVTSIIFRDNDATLGYTIVEDISERKALEQNLQQLYDYQETIVHMVAHDLKSPLNSIKSLSALLQEELEKIPVIINQPEPEIIAFVKMISNSCDRAFSTIRDLLFIGAFKSEEAFEQTDLKIFIQSQIALLEVEAQKKEIEISFLYPAEPVYAHINKNKFTRVLENLISNAIKFTKPQGKITIVLKNQGLKVVLQVKDNGIGIPEKMQGSIFNKFTKANRKGTAGESTTGLGLYIVKQIIDIHKGKIWVESRENEGTSFYIELN